MSEQIPDRVPRAWVLEAYADFVECLCNADIERIAEVEWPRDYYGLVSHALRDELLERYYQRHTDE